MKFIVGKKIEMTQIFKEDGTVIPVTAVLAMPNVVTQIKSAETKDGYNAVQVGFGVAKKNGKSFAGHIKGLKEVKAVKEFKAKTEDTKTLKRGDVITVEVFGEGDEVKVMGTSKGKGFQGVVKRHGFHGSPKTHGHKDQVRMPGSIGAGGVQRVFKGKKMGGHMGDEQVTVSGLKIIAIDALKDILYVKGAVPGARNGLVLISGQGEMTLKQETPKVEVVEEKNEAPVVNEIPVEEVKEEIAVAEETKTEDQPAIVSAENEEIKSE